MSERAPRTIRTCLDRRFMELFAGLRKKDTRTETTVVVNGQTVVVGLERE